MKLIIKTHEYAALPDFRAHFPMESIQEFIRGTAFSLYKPELATIRCSTSGAPQSHITMQEWQDMWITGLYSIGQESFASDSFDFDPDELNDILSLIWEYVDDRLTLAARPSPSLLMENGSFAMAHVHPTRQLAVLLNALFHDSRYMTTEFKSSDDHLDRLRATFATYDWIAQNYSAQMDELRKGLLWLDTHQRISYLRLSNHESERRKHVKIHSSRDVTKILAFVTELTARRLDAEIEVYPQRWSQVAVRDEAIKVSESARRQYSNIWVMAETGRVADKSVKTNPRTSNKPAAPEKPKTEKQTVKATRVSFMLNIIRGNAPKVD